MKKLSNHHYIIFLAIFLLISTSIMPSFGSTNNINSNNQNELTYAFCFSHPIITKNQDTNTYSIQIEDLKNSNAYNLPRVPVKPVTLLLPYATNVHHISVETSNKISLGADIELEKTGKVIPLSMQDSYAISHANVLTKKTVSIQKTDAKSSEEFYSIAGNNILRGYRILNINLYPVQYEEEKGQIDFYEEIQLIIHLKSTDPLGGLRDNDRDFQKVVQYIENPEVLSTYRSAQSNLVQSNEQYEYVIITNDAMKNAQDEYTFQDLVSYKDQKGVSATIVTIEEITSDPDFSVDGIWGDNNPENPFYQTPISNTDIFDDTQARIRNFIRFAYMNWETEFVLLAGDSDTNKPEDIIVPHRGLFADEDGLPLDEKALAYEIDDIPSDVYYACLDGNFNHDEDYHFGDAPKFNAVDDSIDEADLYAEVFVGRACVDSEEEVSNFVKKTIRYDDIFYDDYLKRIVFLGEHLGAQFYFNWGGEYKDLIEPLIPEEYEIIKLYQGQGTWDNDYYWELLNDDPPLIINHDGHGMPTSAMGLSCRVIEEITNEKYYFIYSHTCLAGAFDNCWPPDTYYSTDCVAEYFTVETEHGAIGVVMNARYGLGSETSPESPSGAYDETFFEAVFQKDIRQLGAANHYSKEENIWQVNENGYRWAFYQTNLLGDPEIAIKYPTPKVDVKATITQPQNIGALIINDGEPIELSFLQKPVIIGGITIKADVESIPEDMIDTVEFLIDDAVVGVLSSPPYEYYWDTFSMGSHDIKVVAKSLYDSQDEDTISVYCLW